MRKVSVNLFQGDCLHFLPLLGPDEVDVAILDPPYGTKTADWDNEPDPLVWEHLQRLCSDGPIAVFGYPKQLMRWSRFFDNMELIGYIVWKHYNRPIPSAGLTRIHQDIAIWGKSIAQVDADKVREPYSKETHLAKFHNAGNRLGLNAKAKGKTSRHVDGRRCTDVWDVAAPGIGFNSHLRKHPNEKPEDMVLRFLTLVAGGGDVVLDPFVGSGTTLVAARLVGASAIGIEIEERYCEIAASRLAQGVLPFAEDKK